LESVKKILVIDDEAELTGCIKSILEADYRVFTVFTGRDGLKLLSKENVSLVVLDYSLPDMNGLEILEKIRTEYNIPVIMITAYGTKEVVLKSWRYRADYYFDKPFSLKDLREKVRELTKETFPFEAIGLDPFRLSPKIKRSLEFIGSNLLSPQGKHRKLSLTEIASVTSVSPKYLSALFKKECGLSISQCITRLKVEKAKELLLSDPGKDIRQIALELGYDRSNNFSRAFKSLMGESPSSLKKRTC